MLINQLIARLGEASRVEFSSRKQREKSEQARVNATQRLLGLIGCGPPRFSGRER